MDTTQYIEMFLDESQEHLQAVNDNLLKLEKQPEDPAIVDEIFRSAHTLKGMAATMGYEDIASLTHQMENVLDLIRKGDLHATTAVIDVTFSAIEALEEMVHAISQGGDGKKDVSALIAELEQIEKGHPDKQDAGIVQNSEPDPSLSLDQYQAAVVDQAVEQGLHAYQVTITLNEDCMLKAVRVFMVFEALDLLGDVIQTVPSTQELEEEKFDRAFHVILLTNASQGEVEAKISGVSEIQQVQVTPVKTAEQDNQPTDEPTDEKSETPVSEESRNPPVEQQKQPSSKTIRVNIDRIDRLMNLFEEMVIDRGRLEDLSQKVGDHELTETVERMARVSKDMQSMMLMMRMVPVEQVFNRFPRMVRGLAKDMDKDIELVIHGAETELDRTVIDEIGDPLVHLIRNSIDHGIESRQARKQQGKTEQGTLTLRAFHSGNHVYIEMEDDGGGINRQKVIDKAIENNLLTLERAEQLTDAEVYDLIFASGFSTADQVSDISGRGVGLDVVRSKIESLGGHIFVESEQGKGSIFSIKLPLTLSILSTLLVQVADETYAVPLSSIEEATLLKNSQVMYVQGQPVMDFRGKVVPLVSLKEVFEVPAEARETATESDAVVIVRKGDKMTGLVVDSFLGQKEVVLKSLGAYLQDIYAVSGAAILGNGQVSLILDPNALIK